MNRFAGVRLLPLVMVTSLALTFPAQASRPATPMSGTVTADSIGNEITVDGKTYPVVQTSQNNQSLLSIKVGDQVEVFFDGPPEAKGSRILTIVRKPAASGDN